MQGNGWKLAVAFVIGAVLSFLAGMYVLGPLFAPERADESKTEVQTSSVTTPSLAESIPNGVYRRDVDSVPDHTAVIVERISRPLESIPQTTPTPSQEEVIPPIGQTAPPRYPSQEQPPKPPEQEEPEISEPISPPSEVRPPQPPTTITPTQTTQPPPPPKAKTKRAYRVRIGVFSQEENVKRWLETLTELGYYPYTEEEVSGGQKRYRVYVGAFDNQESAERLRLELKDKGIQSVIEERQE